MKVINTKIPGVKILEPKVYGDGRGWFCETFRAGAFRRYVADVAFVQDNESCSQRGVVRGLHFQRPPYSQAKLVRVSRGCVFDVVVDLRRNSPTYGEYVAVELSEENHRQLFLPRGCAHGFATISETAVFEYKCDNYYHPESEGGVSIFDDALGIEWPIPASEMILSAKDLKHPALSELGAVFGMDGDDYTEAEKTVLVTGANGQLGMAIQELISRYPKMRFLLTDVDELNLTDADAVQTYVERHKPDIIINCAAYTDVERAEDEPEKAELVNVGGVVNLARAARGVDALLVHVSTDYVFGGNVGSEPLGEDTPAMPLSVYGRTKLMSEQAVMEAGVRHLIVRTSWLYSPWGRNFVKTMLRLMGEKRTLSVVNDQKGSPTYAPDLAEAVMALIECGAEGVYHFSSEGECSWYDFAAAIGEISGKTACAVSPCTTEEYPVKARRPAYSVMSKDKYRKQTGRTVPYWKDSLKRMLDTL